MIHRKRQVKLNNNNKYGNKLKQRVNRLKKLLRNLPPL